MQDTEIWPEHRKRREKGREKELGVGGKEEKDNRKKVSVLLFYHKLLFFSSIPSVEGRLRVQRAGPGA